MKNASTPSYVRHPNFHDSVISNTTDLDEKLSSIITTVHDIHIPKTTTTTTTTVLLMDPPAAPSPLPSLPMGATVNTHTDDEHQQQQDDDDDDDDESVNILNDLDGGHDRDENTIVLLKQIFPDESAENLWQFHLQRCHRPVIVVAATDTTTGSRRPTHSPPPVPTMNVPGESPQVEEEEVPSSSSVPMSTKDTSTDIDSITKVPQQKQQQQPHQHRPRRKGNHSSDSNRVVMVPNHFLRLPPEIAVRRYIDGKWQYQLVDQFTKQVIVGHERQYGQLHHMNRSPSSSRYYCTKVISRDATGGLGMTLISNEHQKSPVGSLPLIRVGALLSSSSNYDDPNDGDGPAYQAGVRCNDILIGIDGVAFAEITSYNTGGASRLLRQAVTMIRNNQFDPVVLHFIRETNVVTNHNTVNQIERTIPKTAASSSSLFDTSDVYIDDESSLLSQSPPLLPGGDTSLHSDLSCSQTTSIVHDMMMLTTTTSSSLSDLTIRPFINVLVHTNLMSSQKEEQIRVSNILNELDQRANQWDELSAFFDPSNDTVISLMNVRKALSVRIVNIFDDNVDTAYTIWVYDSECGKEWYAPVRYLRDFIDLRSSVLSLCTTSIQRIPFPKIKGTSLDLFLRRSPKQRMESNVQRETKCRQLEHFLRVLCAMPYKEKLHPYIAEVAIHVQSFLGCDIQENNADTNTLCPHPSISLLPKYVNLSKTDDNALRPDTVAEMNHNNDVPEHRWIDTRLRLKRALQCFTYRLLLLDELQQIVDRFVDRLRISGPSLYDIEDLEAKGPNVLKERALVDLRQIQSFLDKIQDMILEGCRDDFAKIAKRSEFTLLHTLIFRSTNGSVYWDTLVREAVREQVEVEIYVPLRSVVSRWLVNGWRHEDMEVYFRMNELRRRCRPPNILRWNHNELHPDWSTVIQILSVGVGLSTLPCMKLRAIVDAAREIFRILHQPNEKKRVKESDTIGADDLLPIFIHCVVQAEIERPCALCVLLQTLCDPIHRIGEIGYYLLTFEAAIRHCQEVDFSDAEEMPSFQSIALDDT
jgi:hypothetical protein